MLNLLTIAAALAAATSSAGAKASPPAPQLPPSSAVAMTLKLDRDEGGEHMCPDGAQLTSFQANSTIDNAPVVVELLGPDRKPLPEKGWGAVAGLRVLPLVQGPLRLVMVCLTK